MRRVELMLKCDTSAKAWTKVNKEISVDLRMPMVRRLFTPVSLYMFKIEIEGEIHERL